jgi:hypothetical protein
MIAAGGVKAKGSASNAKGKGQKAKRQRREAVPITFLPEKR